MTKILVTPVTDLSNNKMAWVGILLFGVVLVLPTFLYTLLQLEMSPDAAEFGNVVYAHRGAHNEAPENTLLAVRNAASKEPKRLKRIFN